MNPDSKHTPGPWVQSRHVTGNGVTFHIGARPGVIASVGDRDLRSGTAKANANRIVVCVNAFEPGGVVDQLLEAAQAVSNDHDVQHAVGRSSEAQYKLRALTKAIQAVKQAMEENHGLLH